jgi:hypothetical protein
LRKQALIERDHVAADTLARKIPFDKFAAGLTEFAPQLGIACEPIDGAGERLGILDGDQKRVEVRPRDISASGHVSCDQRPPAGSRFQQAQGQALAVRRQNRDVRACPQCTYILYEAEMFDIGPPRPRLDLLRRNRARVGGVWEPRYEELDVAAAPD